MKKTYIIPALKVDEADMADGLLSVTSIQVTDDPGSEEYAKEQPAAADWDIDW